MNEQEHDQSQHPIVRTRPRNPYKVQAKSIRKLWRHEDPVSHIFGIEWLWMMMLAIIVLVLPITAIRWTAGQLGLKNRYLAVEAYAVAKPLLLISLLVLYSPSKLSIIAACFFLFDLYTYLMGLLFLRNLYRPPVSYGRSILLLGINYIESTVSFAILYISLGGIVRGKEALVGVIDAVYFSIITSATVGYGDITPVGNLAKIVVVVQVCSSFIFVTTVLSSFMTNLMSSRERTERA